MPKPEDMHQPGSWTFDGAAALDAHLWDRERESMRAVIWTAWRELNAIRARDGAPCGVDPSYFSAVVDACETILGDDTKPWPNKRWLEQDGSFSFDAILQRVRP